MCWQSCHSKQKSCKPRKWRQSTCFASCNLCTPTWFLYIYINILYFYALPVFSMTWVTICNRKPHVYLFSHHGITRVAHPRVLVVPFGASPISRYIKPLSAVRLDVGTIPLQTITKSATRCLWARGSSLHKWTFAKQTTRSVESWETVCTNLVKHNVVGYQIQELFFFVYFFPKANVNCSSHL